MKASNEKIHNESKILKLTTFTISSQSAHKMKKKLFLRSHESLSIAVFYQGIKKKELKAVCSTLLQSIDYIHYLVLGFALSFSWKKNSFVRLSSDLKISQHGSQIKEIWFKFRLEGQILVVLDFCTNRAHIAKGLE